MALTSTIFNYNVAKIIDTPWNTIVNGMNYTKTNLSPLGLKYTYSASANCGMLLKEYAGNSCVTGGPIEDFCWYNADYDCDNPELYWILNGQHKSYNTSYYYMRKAQRMVDDNGFEYSNITTHNVMSTPRGGGRIICQDNQNIYVYHSDVYYGSTGNVAQIYKVAKKGVSLSATSVLSITNGIIHILDVSNGYIWYYTQSGTTGSLSVTIGKIEINTGYDTQIYSTSVGSIGVITSYPTNIVDESFYVYYFGADSIRKYTFNDLRKSVTKESISFDENTSIYTTVGATYTGDMKRFQHIYTVGDEKYLVATTLNCYHRQQMDEKSTIQTYKIDGNTLVRTQKIDIHGLSFIPKNDWNTWFIGESSGIRVFNWDSIEKKMYEKSTIYTTCQQFGFDIDERLWIMDVDYNIYRYTYNQPTTIDYKFEVKKYSIGTEIVESYVDVRVMNYMGDNLTSEVKIKAIGNFTFINNQKEIALTLTSNGYMRLPIYINGAGKYEIKLV